MYIGPSTVLYMYSYSCMLDVPACLDAGRAAVAAAGVPGRLLHPGALEATTDAVVLRCVR